MTTMDTLSLYRIRRMAAPAGYRTSQLDGQIIIRRYDVADEGAVAAMNVWLRRQGFVMNAQAVEVGDVHKRPAVQAVIILAEPAPPPPSFHVIQLDPDAPWHIDMV